MRRGLRGECGGAYAEGAEELRGGCGALTTEGAEGLTTEGADRLTLRMRYFGSPRGRGQGERVPLADVRFRSGPCWICRTFDARSFRVMSRARSHSESAVVETSSFQ